MIECVSTQFNLQKNAFHLSSMISLNSTNAFQFFFKPHSSKHEVATTMNNVRIVLYLASDAVRVTRG